MIFLFFCRLKIDKHPQEALGEAIFYLTNFPGDYKVQSRLRHTALEPSVFLFLILLFFLIYFFIEDSESKVTQSCPTLSNLMDCILPDSSVHGIFQARVLEWAAIAFSSSFLYWTTFCHTSLPWSIRLGWSHMAWLSFIELDKGVVRVIRSASFLWLWFQCVCPLMPSLSAYCLTRVSLTLDVGYLLSAARCTSTAQPPAS